MKIADAWTNVTEMFNGTWGTGLSKDDLRKKYNSIQGSHKKC